MKLVATFHGVHDTIPSSIGHTTDPWWWLKFQRARRRARIWFWQRRPLAATCGHLRPLAATCGHLRPLAATCSGGHLRLQVAASGCRWKENAGATGGHWRPLDWLQVAASGYKWLPLRRECWRTLAATGGHSIGCKWLQVAAGETVRRKAGGHWGSLDWPQVGASGCRWEENDGGHWRPWLQVAASGCQAWVKLYFSPFILSWAENIGNFPLPARCARKKYNILRGRVRLKLSLVSVLLLEAGWPCCRKQHVFCDRFFLLATRDACNATLQDLAKVTFPVRQREQHD